MKAYQQKDVYATLKKYWGYDSFRPLQEEIIASVLDGVDTLALLPTGGGKSLCFQIPGLLSGGTTLVVSPLIALMNDQVQNLRKRGISAVAISAAMSFKEIDIALNNAALGHVQFLYVSPERLQNEDFRQKCSYLPITLLAVDEAHCISQWGYDFRPSYLSIAELRDYFPDVTVVALTASATQPVVDDIRTQLKFEKGVVLRQSFKRANLRYVVQQEENKAERLLKLIRNLGGSGVVYVRNRKKTEEIAQFLKRQGISALPYHAGLNYDKRQSIQQQWIENKIQVICATNAFGMGIDKPDVRFVVHLDLPESLEAYFQEAGRGGRDGKVAYATLFYTGADQQRLLDHFAASYPEPDTIRQTYQAICNYYQIAVGAGQGTSVEFEIDKICSNYHLQPVTVYNSIKFLEKENFVSLLDAGFEPSKVMLLAGKEQLYEFQLQFPRYEPLLKTLLRSYGGLFEGYVYINEKDLAYRVKLSAPLVSDYLGKLNESGILSYVPQTVLPRLVFTSNRVPSKFLDFDPKHYHLLKENHKKRIDAVLDYTNNNQICRQVQLLMYFYESDITNCGFCDVCISKKHSDLESIKQRITGLLMKTTLGLRDLEGRLSSINNEHWIKALNELIDDGVVYEKESVYGLKERT